MTTSKTRSNVCKLAWNLVKNNGFTLAEAMKQAWKNIKLTAAMLGKVVHFTFRKVDGTIREAVGTLVESLLPALKGTGRKASQNVQVYFDLDRKAFRSFKKDSLISFEA